jgi:hypothetical protein
MFPMKKTVLMTVALTLLAMAAPAFAQKDVDNEPTSWISFVVIKDDNGKPVRNAAVIMHPVTTKGKQGKGGMELKTNADGKTDFDGIPYGPLRVQVLAQGFQTYGEDYDVQQPKMQITIKLKRPQGQYSVYEDHASNPQPKQDAPPAGQDKKPN